MMSELLWLWPLVGLVWMAIGIPLIWGIVPRNRWYGFRVTKTYSSDRLWYAANLIAGRELVLAGAIVLVVSIVSIGCGNWFEPIFLQAVNFGTFIVATSVTTWRSFRHLEQL